MPASSSKARGKTPKKATTKAAAKGAGAEAKKAPSKAPSAKKVGNKIGSKPGKPAGKQIGKAADKARTPAIAASGGASKPAPQARPAGRAPAKARPAFPNRNVQPSLAEFPARLPFEQGKRFEALRSYLCKQRGVAEEMFYYGPKTGWGLRYVLHQQVLCSVLIHGDRPVGILSLDRDTDREVDWNALSTVGTEARQKAHGSPALLWLDLPLDGRGAADFKLLLRTKASRFEQNRELAAKQTGAPRPASEGKRKVANDRR